MNQGHDIFHLPTAKACAIVNRMVKHQSRSLNITFAALADPTRRCILERLSQGPERVTTVAGRFAMSLPAVSKHVRVLERAGLLKRHRQGREHRLELVARPMKEALSWMEKYRQFWEGTLDALAGYLENNNQTRKGKS